MLDRLKNTERSYTLPTIPVTQTFSFRLSRDEIIHLLDTDRTLRPAKGTKLQLGAHAKARLLRSRGLAASLIVDINAAGVAFKDAQRALQRALDTGDEATLRAVVATEIDHLGTAMQTYEAFLERLC